MPTGTGRTQIQVKLKTRKRLNVFKAINDFKDVDEVINYLIDREEEK